MMGPTHNAVHTPGLPGFVRFGRTVGSAAHPRLRALVGIVAVAAAIAVATPVSAQSAARARIAAKARGNAALVTTVPRLLVVEESIAIGDVTKLGEGNPLTLRVVVKSRTPPPLLAGVLRGPNRPRHVELEVNWPLANNVRRFLDDINPSRVLLKVPDTRFDLAAASELKAPGPFLARVVLGFLPTAEHNVLMRALGSVELEVRPRAAVTPADAAGFLKAMEGATTRLIVIAVPADTKRLDAVGFLEKLKPITQPVFLGKKQRLPPPRLEIVVPAPPFDEKIEPPAPELFAAITALNPVQTWLPFSTAWGAWGEAFLGNVPNPASLAIVAESAALTELFLGTWETFGRPEGRVFRTDPLDADPDSRRPSYAPKPKLSRDLLPVRE